ncbi:MAG: DUF488 domain-containing protein [Chloroflexota bacterium]|nr:DUF488 domain-containing protein [Chloroflexota bacterium]
MVTDGVTIYTIGHSNLAAGEIVALLLTNEIAAVVDVRSVPHSQYSPQFNRNALDMTLKQAGIVYKYAGDTLGGRPRDPTCYRSGTIPTGKTKYSDVVLYEEVARRRWYQAGIRDLIETARQMRTVIMCSEENPLRCHRNHLITPTLLREQVTVRHIRKGGNIETAMYDPIEESREDHKQMKLL